MATNEFCCVCGCARLPGKGCSNKACDDPLLVVRLDATMAAIDMARRAIDDLAASVHRLVVQPGARKKIAQRLRASEKHHG